MTNGKWKPRRNSVGRMIFVGISLILQLSWLMLMILELNTYSTYLSLLTNVLTSLAVLRLYSKHTNAAYRMPWIMVMMALPVMGLSLYVLSEAAITPRHTRHRMEAARNRADNSGNHQPRVGMGRPISSKGMTE